MPYYLPCCIVKIYSRIVLTYDMSKRCVALLSGGLDSTIAVKLMQEQGIEVKALAVKTPFCDFDCGKGCGFKVREVADELGIDLKTVYLGREYLEMLKNPKYGYGSAMNPCIDCRIMMFKAAKEYMESVGADFLVTGEVLEQRPMSQNSRALKIIEEESGLKGRVLRPLSAKCLRPTDVEVKGYVNRDKLLSIRGRSRKVQLSLAKRFTLTNVQNSSGGCILTDKYFAKKLKDLMDHCSDITLNDVELLKVGRHFRLGADTKLIVGRNKDENEIIESLSDADDLLLEPADVKGPKALLRGNYNDDILTLSARIVCRYSDSSICTIIMKKGNKVIKEVNTEAIDSQSLESYRI